MIKRLLFIALFLPMITLGNDIRQEIANSLKSIAYEKNIDARVFYVFAKTESDFEPYIISFLTADGDFIKRLKTAFSDTNFKFRSSKYDKSRYAVSIYSHNKADMIALADFFWDFNFNVDFGLMQISKQNLNRAELAQIFDPSYNIYKSYEVLSNCMKKYDSSSKDVIECYNKGFGRKKKYDYYAKFINYYNDFFGDKQ
ncbi:transglycosylase SLT domain-containing protein [Campylobacter concisus]|jgi:conjugal transfer protein